MDLVKLDASIARFKARTLELRAKRHTTVRIEDVPKSRESAHTEKTARTLPAAACRCQAKTMEGKQCGFRAVAGAFCKKHAIKNL